ncbi:Hypothetical protein PHPALM_6995, partial [Phytophthora palmivora]
MMKTLLGAALCGIAATMTATSASTLFPHVPLIMWSQRPTLAGNNVYLSSEMDEAAVASTLKNVLDRDSNADRAGVLSTQVTSSQQAELLCLFLLPSLASEDVSQLSSGADSYLQSAVHSSVSSVVIPHTTRTKALLPEMTSAKPHIVGVHDLDVFISSAEGKMLFTNDAIIQEASTNLNTVTDGKTDFVFTGNDATSVELKDPLARRLALQAKTKKTNSSTEAATFITPDIMAGLLFGLLFIFMAYIG